MRIYDKKDADGNRRITLELGDNWLIFLIVLGCLIFGIFGVGPCAADPPKQEEPPVERAVATEEGTSGEPSGEPVFRVEQ
jgi:hypothetical protein